MYIRNIKSDLRSRLASVDQVIGYCTRVLSDCPDGRLRIQRQDSRIYYHHVNSSTPPSGSPITDKSLIRTLAQKSYAEAVLKAAQKERNTLQKMLAGYDGDELQKIYESYSAERKELVNPVMLPDEEFKNRWLSKPYTPREFKPGTPVYLTMKGERVRSKSEQIIADRLANRGIPYKYECPFPMEDFSYHPDFTILRMSDRREIYYEHFGMMDREDYANDNVLKINQYSERGLILGDNLFATFETRSNPLDFRVLDRLISSKFL